MSRHQAARPSAYLRLFREPGYPLLSVDLSSLLDRSLREIEHADDPMDVACDLAATLELAAQAVRDLGAEHFLATRSQAS